MWPFLSERWGFQGRADPKKKTPNKPRRKTLLSFLPSWCSKDKILRYNELCKPEWISDVTLAPWWSQILGMLGVTSGVMWVCLSSTSAPSRLIDVACALGTSRNTLCALLFTRGWFFFLIFVSQSGKAFIFPSVTQSLSHWERSLYHLIAPL